MSQAAVKSNSPKNFWRTGTVWLVVGLVSLLLVACGDAATPIPPTATPSFQQKFRQDNNPDLFYTMNFPEGWTRAAVDATSVVYTSPTDANLKIGLVSKSIVKLKPDDQSLLQVRTTQVKNANPGTREDPGGGGTLNLLDTTVSVNRLSYSSNNNDLIQYIAQVNNVKAERGYLLFGISTAKDSSIYQPLYFDSFRSFTSSAPEVARGESGVADPTVLVANAGGKIRPVNAREVRGQYLKMVEWQSPPLNVNVKQPTLSGTFPLDYDWRLRPFPTPAQPALYLTSPIVDNNANQAVIQIAIFKDAFKSATPSADDWRAFYSPTLNTLAAQYVQSFGTSIQPLEVTQAGPLYRVPFTARNTKGEVGSRGFILFGHSGTHGILGVISISPGSAAKQNLVDGFDRDFQTIISSLKVNY